jgi:hypothetical protein
MPSAYAIRGNGDGQHTAVGRDVQLRDRRIGERFAEQIADDGRHLRAHVREARRLELFG